MEKRKKIVLRKKKILFKKKRWVNRKYIEDLLVCQLWLSEKVDRRRRQPKNCPLFLIQKNGTFVSSAKSYLIDYEDVIRLLQNQFSYAHLRFPFLVGRDEKDILDKILTIYQCQQENIVFYIENHELQKGNKEYRVIEDLYQTDKTIEMIFLRHTNLEKFTKIYFYQQCLYGKIPNFKIKTKTYIDRMAWIYYIQSLLYYEKQPDAITASRLFYKIYVKTDELQSELKKKYNIDIRTDVDNYQKLYLLLKKLGYVDRFYKKILPVCKRRFHKIESMILRNSYYVEYLKYFNSYRPFEERTLFDTKDIDLEKVIEVHVSDRFNKKWILDQYRLVKNDPKLHFHISIS